MTAPGTATGPALSADQRIVAAVGLDPEETVRRWSVDEDRVLDVDWARVVLLAIQHHVEGLLVDALVAAGWDGRISPSVTSVLRRRADLAEARYRTTYDALCQLADCAPDLVRGLVFFKGASIGPRYDSPRHRMMGDFDFVVTPDREAELRETLTRLGYWEKGGANGPTFFRDNPTPQVGVEHVVFDVHVGAPPKYNRTSSSLSSRWLDDSVPHVLGALECRRLSAPFELLEVLTHASEHLSSWVHVCQDDDVRLIRMLDVELLCANGSGPGDGLGDLAGELGLTGELALGIAMVLVTRGGLPDALASYRPAAEAVVDLLDECAMPGGTSVRWDEPLATRAFRVDRGMQAMRLVPADQRDRLRWYDPRRGMLAGKEDVAAVAARARERLRTAGSGRSSHAP